MSARRIFVTGMSVITPYGPGIDRFWNGLVANENRIVTDPHPVPSGDTLSAPMPAEFATEVANQYGGRKNAWAMDRMLAEALGGQKLAGRGSVYFGNSFDADAYEHSDPSTREWRVDRWADWLREKTGAETAAGVLLACSAANMATALAADSIAYGDTDWALVGAMDLLHPELLVEVDCLRMISKTGCRPFSDDHDGSVIGDGAGLLLLESEEHAAARGARPLVEVAGFGIATDEGTGKFTPDGSVAREMMAAGITAAGLQPSDVDFINAAATGSALVDDLEKKAIDSLFGQALPIVYSVKSLVGQSIGGTGAVETIATILSLLRQQVPAALSDPRGPTSRPRLDVALNNAIAMSGQMCTTVFRRVAA